MNMLEMTKTVLKGVSFDKSLFEKELYKSKNWIQDKDIAPLKTWCDLNFGKAYRKEIDNVFREDFIL